MKKQAKTAIKCPSKLGKSGRKYWEKVLEEFEIEPYQVDLLTSACQQLDRAESAAQIIAVEGVTAKDRFGQSKPHPAVEVERNAHMAFLRLSRELGLDIEPAEVRGPSRPGTRS